MAVRFSIIVPVFDQWHLIPRLLEHLDRQSLDPNAFELLLVDNGSRDFSPHPLPRNGRLLTCVTPGSYAARNAAITEVNGSWLIFTDADCQPEADWLEQIECAVAGDDTESTIFAGAVLTITNDNESLNCYQMYEMVKGIPQAWYVRRGYGATANLCVPKRIIQDIGPFDAQRFSGGDAELCRRARACGYRLEYLPDAVIKHPARDSWQALATKARRVKGGQLTAGSLPQRAMYFVRSFTPPVFAVWRFLRQENLPRHYRVIAALIQMRIWLVDMREAVRLSLGMSPERR